MKNKVIILIISVVVSLLVHFPEFMALFDHGHTDVSFGEVKLSEIVCEVGYLLLTLLFLFWINSFIFRYYTPDRRLRWYVLPLSFFLTWILNNLFGLLFLEAHQHLHIPAINSTLHYYLHPFWDFIISFVVTGSCYVIHLAANRQSILIENQRLRTESLRNQYETLKGQLNPHMFFNSLNTLNTLIRESPQKAQDYTCQLSKVLRYTLQTTESRGVTLREELEFVKAYTYLLETRYEDNFSVQFTIDNSLMEYALPPMAVQLLIENAVKHNEISNKRPLVISIKSEEETLVVSNPIQPKIGNTQGDGIGLHNLNKRYNLIFGKQIEIKLDEENYQVTLPLIHK
ncbi:MAG: sensor histidine kinase [Phocaeicola sp.]